jgi:glycosyltransferase involved in cell wall biosynthesis
MKLLFVVENSCYGGGEKTFSLLIRGLPKEKFGIYCAAPPSGRFHEEVKDHCRFLPLDLSCRLNFKNIWRLKKMIMDYGIDVAHSQGARADFFCAMAAAKAGVKAVSTVARPLEGFDAGPVRKRVNLFLNSVAVRRTEAALTVSAALGEKLRGRYRAVSLIPNPVDLAEFDPANFNAAPVIERYGLRGRFVLGSLGRLERQKGHTHLLAALEILIAKEPALKEKITCLLAGSGSLEGRLKAQAAEAGLSGNVMFCGEISDVRDFLAASDIFVMPSLAEGQPLALLEAMAMGKPVVASDIDGINETAVSGSEALLVPPADPSTLAEAILKLVRDMPTALAMGRKAREKALQYGLPQYLLRHSDFYTAIPFKEPR